MSESIYRRKFSTYGQVFANTQMPAHRADAGRQRWQGQAQAAHGEKRRGARYWPRGGTALPLTRQSPRWQHADYHQLSISRHTVPSIDPAARHVIRKRPIKRGHDDRPGCISRGLRSQLAAGCDDRRRHTGQADWSGTISRRGDGGGQRAHRPRLEVAAPTGTQWQRPPDRGGVGAGRIRVTALRQARRRARTRARICRP